MPLQAQERLASGAALPSCSCFCCRQSPGAAYSTWRSPLCEHRTVKQRHAVPRVPLSTTTTDELFCGFSASLETSSAAAFVPYLQYRAAASTGTCRSCNVSLWNFVELFRGPLQPRTACFELISCDAAGAFAMQLINTALQQPCCPLTLCRHIPNTSLCFLQPCQTSPAHKHTRFQNLIMLSAARYHCSEYPAATCLSFLLTHLATRFVQACPAGSTALAQQRLLCTGPERHQRLSPTGV